MEGRSKNSFYYHKDKSRTFISYELSPEGSPPGNTNNEWNDEERDFRGREHLDMERDSKSCNKYQENFGRAYVSYPLARERSPTTPSNSSWVDELREHQSGKNFNRGLHREINKSRPYFIKNRESSRDESKSREKWQLLDGKKSSAQETSLITSQQQNEPVYSAYRLKQADHTSIVGNKRLLLDRGKQKQLEMPQSLQEEASPSQIVSQQQTESAYSAYRFNQGDHSAVDSNIGVLQEAPQSLQQQTTGEYSVHGFKPELNQEGQQQQVQQPLQQETYQPLKPPMPVYSEYRVNQADHTSNDGNRRAPLNGEGQILQQSLQQDKSPLQTTSQQQIAPDYSARRFKPEPNRGGQQTQQTLPQATYQPVMPRMVVCPAYGSNQTNQTFVNGNRRAIPMLNYPPPPWGMNPMHMSFNPAASMLPIAHGVEMGSGINPVANTGMPGIGSLYDMMIMGNDHQFGIKESEMDVQYIKELITLSNCVMCPPHPDEKMPLLRPRPPGCKTVFVGGLPEKATEEIIREIFERCGKILVIRMSKKRFCYIRFAEESHVDNAINLCGYKLKIENKNDPAHFNKLHVDFSYSREDEHEYECKLRKAQREARHKVRMEQEARRKQKLEEEARREPTPPPVASYSDQEAAILVGKLHGIDTFQEALGVFRAWLERGECKKRNVASFYSMIQSTNSRVRILMNEKQKYEDEVNKAKIMLNQKIQDILLQFHEIDKVFSAASVQKNWDLFTKAQRKNIEMWKKQMAEVKNVYLEEVLDDHAEDEKNISDDQMSISDDDAPQESKKNSQNLQEELNKLKEECDSLKCQLITSQNELQEVRLEMDQKSDAADRQAQALRQALQGLWQENLSLNEKLANDKDELEELRTQKSYFLNEGNEDLKIEDYEKEKRKLFGFLTSSSVRLITENEARLIGLIAAFLNVYPLGTSIECICTYLRQIDRKIRTRDVEYFMKRFTLAFKEETTGSDGSLEKMWTFLGVT